VSKDDSHPELSREDAVSDPAEVAQRLRAEMRIATGRLRTALADGALTGDDAAQDDGATTRK
jgi:hypothetical protein